MAEKINKSASELDDLVKTEIRLQKLQQRQQQERQQLLQQQQKQLQQQLNAFCSNLSNWMNETKVSQSIINKIKYGRKLRWQKCLKSKTEQLCFFPQVIWSLMLSFWLDLTIESTPIHRPTISTTKWPNHLWKRGKVAQFLISNTSAKAKFNFLFVDKNLIALAEVFEIKNWATLLFSTSDLVIMLGFWLDLTIGPTPFP